MKAYFCCRTIMDKMKYENDKMFACMVKVMCICFVSLFDSIT